MIFTIAQYILTLKNKIRIRRKTMFTLTPPMGWNSWNTFAENIDEKLIRDTADIIVEKGLDKLGYNYVIIDDCWAEKTRDKNGRLVPDKKKFPSGMKALSDYIHSKGLKFGMYSCAGTLTCAGYPSSFEYEFIDANTFAEWGVDYLKYDFCFKPEYVQGKTLYRRMGAALANCGRDIFFAACSWGAEKTHEWIRSTGAGSWRSTGDIFDNWESVKKIILQQVDRSGEYCGAGAMPFGGLGCFNDMDMLIVGMKGKGHVGLGGCSLEEYRTHFSAWAIFASPLIIGCDLRDIDPEAEKILTNKEVIALNQDARGAQPYIANEVWMKQNNDNTPVVARLLANGDIAVALFNLKDEKSRVDFRGDQIGLSPSTKVKLYARDLWSGEEFDIHNYTYYTNIEPHACKLLRVKVVPQL